MKPVRFGSDSKEVEFGQESRETTASAETRENYALQIPELHPSFPEHSGLRPFEGGSPREAMNSQADLDRIAEIDRENERLQADLERDRRARDAVYQERKETYEHAEHLMSVFFESAGSLVTAAGIGLARLAAWIAMGTYEISSAVFHSFVMSGPLFFGATMRFFNDSLQYIGESRGWTQPAIRAAQFLTNGSLMAGALYFTNGLFTYNLSLTALGIFATPLLAPIFPILIVGGIVALGYYSKDIIKATGGFVKRRIFGRKS